MECSIPASGLEDDSLPFRTPQLSVGLDVPLWVAFGVGDFLVNMVMMVVMLARFIAHCGV